MNDERESKLPAWARNLLAKERARADQAEYKLACHTKTVEPTNIWYGDFKNPIYVPNQYGHQRIHLELGKPQDHYTEMQVSITRDGRLEVQGGHSLSIDMQSSNTFQVRFV